MLDRRRVIGDRFVTKMREAAYLATLVESKSIIRPEFDGSREDL